MALYKYEKYYRKTTYSLGSWVYDTYINKSWDGYAYTYVYVDRTVGNSYTAGYGYTFSETSGVTLTDTIYLDWRNDDRAVPETYFVYGSYETTRRLYYIRSNTIKYDGIRYYKVDYANINRTYSKGAFIETVVAEDGTYPDNGVSGSYWYVKVGLAFPSFNIKIDGTLRETIGGGVKINGVIRNIDTISLKVNGVIKQI